MISKPFWKRGKLIFLLLLPIPAFLVSLLIGAYPLPADVALGIFFSKLLYPAFQYPSLPVQEAVIFDLRLPRIVLAILGGIA
ncbi:MAG TPA: hypothetical protein P5168_05465, partial [Candidatus Methanomethylicus sp.]|nr:hypothetical protein [Candidatus Methanomethylicus sp.]